MLIIALGQYMEITVFLARFYGVFFLTIALSLLINRKQYVKMMGNVDANPVILFVWGIIPLIIGLVTILLHPIWDGSMAMSIPIIGSVLLGVGMLRLILMRYIICMLSRFHNLELFLVIGAVLQLALGIFFMDLGFLYRF